jgi:hypothetical protein
MSLIECADSCLVPVLKSINRMAKMRQKSPLLGGLAAARDKG